MSTFVGLKLLQCEVLHALFVDAACVWSACVPCAWVHATHACLWHEWMRATFNVRQMFEYRRVWCMQHACVVRASGVHACDWCGVPCAWVQRSCMHKARVHAYGVRTAHALAPLMRSQAACPLIPRIKVSFWRTSYKNTGGRYVSNIWRTLYAGDRGSFILGLLYVCNMRIKLGCR
jgi:hypothetical protein